MGQNVRSWREDRLRVDVLSLLIDDVGRWSLVDDGCGVWSCLVNRLSVHHPVMQLIALERLSGIAFRIAVSVSLNNRQYDPKANCCR